MTHKHIDRKSKLSLSTQREFFLAQSQELLY